MLATLITCYPAFAATERTIYNFGTVSSGDGRFSLAGLIRDASGNLYGTTSQGGAYCVGQSSLCGVVFKLTPPSSLGGKWTESIIWNFGGYSGDGLYPFAGLIMDGSGHLFGTTEKGGAGGGGTVFELTPPFNQRRQLDRVDSLEFSRAYL